MGKTILFLDNLNAAFVRGDEEHLRIIDRWNVHGTFVVLIHAESLTNGPRSDECVA